MRVDIALLLGERSPVGHREATHVHGNSVRVDARTGKSGHQRWLEGLDEVVDDKRRICEAFQAEIFAAASNLESYRDLGFRFAFSFPWRNETRRSTEVVCQVWSRSANSFAKLD